MKIVEAQGYSREKAYETTGIELPFKVLRNATITWKNEGSPINGKKLKDFFTKYFKDKRVVGAYVVLTPSSEDTRKRPYTIINEVTKGKRKASTTYQVIPADFKVKETKTTLEDGTEEIVQEVPENSIVELGAAEGRATKKDEALTIMKKLIKENRKNYVIKLVKEITEGQKYAAYGLYTPSASAELGQFVYAVEE